MLRLLLIFLLCLIQANCFDVEKYDDMLRRIMENDEVRAKRSPEIETFGSGGNDPGDLTPDTLSPTIIMAIVVSGLIALGTLFFLASCAWYKYKARYQSQPFARLTLDDDESGLNMVDYDELSAQHSQLTTNVIEESSNFSKA